MLKNTLILYAMLFFSLAFNQNADLVTQKIQLENAMREKVDFTLSRQLDPSQYIIVVNARLDSGKIILQKKVKISKNETEASLAKKILAQEHKLYPKAILKAFNL